MTDKKRWYVVQAFSGYEKRVAESLREHIKMHGMEDKFGDILVPTEEVVEMKGGKRAKSERKFFPGYVLVEMSMDEASWHLVKSIPRVLGFIGGKADRPTPITQKEADTILNRLQDSVDKPVNDGPFADFNGTVESVDYDKNRLTVSVSIFGRATPVELEFGQVEKA
jgi:transcriptional antiterminator NusG